MLLIGATARGSTRTAGFALIALFTRPHMLLGGSAAFVLTYHSFPVVSNFRLATFAGPAVTISIGGNRSALLPSCDAVTRIAF
jgi:hypothetical protein